ncbi:MAG: class I SAM-dependent methyltransferase [Acidobacteriota bacterium]
MNHNESFAHRRAQRALQRQLEYQQQKAQKLRGHEPQLISGMTRASAEVRAKLQHVRPIADAARVLEVGSGAHGLIFYFGAQNGIGADPLAHHYSSLFPAWQQKAPTIGALGEALPFPDHSFDVVLCDNVVDHAESPTQIVSEIVRVLAPSGMLYFTVNVHHPIYSLASEIHGIWQRLGVPYEVGPFADHTVHLTVPRARELFARQPLRMVKETTDLEMARTRAQHTRARHAGDRLKRVFFKNAVYEVIAVREGPAIAYDAAPKSWQPRGG